MPASLCDSYSRNISLEDFLRRIHDALKQLYKKFWKGSLAVSLCIHQNMNTSTNAYLNIFKVKWGEDNVLDG